MKTQLVDIIYTLSNKNGEQFVKFDLSTFTDEELDCICDSSDQDKIKFVVDNLMSYESNMASRLLQCLMYNKSINEDFYCQLLSKFSKNFLESIRLGANSTNTILHWAVAENKLKIINYLLKDKQLNVNLTNYMKETILHTAVMLNYSPNIVYDLVKFLVDVGNCNIYLKDTDKKTALIKCIENNRSFDTFKLIADKMDSMGQCNEIIECAFKFKRDDILIYLFKRNFSLSPTIINYLAQKKFNFALQ